MLKILNVIFMGLISMIFIERSDASDYPFTGSAEKLFKSDQNILFQDLFRNYNREIHPVLSHDQVIEINFEIALFNVLELNAKQGEMTTNLEVILRWHDPFLTWDPALYNYTYVLRVPHHKIWEPDIILYNSAARDYSSSIISTNAIIDSSGEVKLLLQAIFVSTCWINIAWYPFDQQICDLMFGSRTSDVMQIRITKGDAQISRYEHNHEFVLENFYADMGEIMDPCCDSPFALVSYHVQLQRRYKFPVFFFIMPGILINICAVLVFSLPAESGEKVGLGINSLLAMMVFLMAMINNLPPAESIPLAGMYYGVCLAVITTNIALSVGVMNLSHGGERGYKLPWALKIMTKAMSRWLRVSVHPIVQRHWQRQEEQEQDGVLFESPTVFERSERAWRSLKVRPKTPENADNNPWVPVKRGEGLPEASPIPSAEERDVFVEEWKLASRVMDRFLFILFSVITVLFNSIMLTSSPYGIDMNACNEDEGSCHVD